MTAELLLLPISKQKPVRRSLCQTLRHSFQWKCFLLSILIDGCTAVIFWCQFTVYDEPEQKTGSRRVYDVSNLYRPMKGPCDRGYNFIPIAFAVMLYIVYLMECWHCKTRYQLAHKIDVSTVYEKVGELQQTTPVVWWRAVCYHYIRRTRQVTRYRNGDAVTTTQVYYERVNTHSADAVFLYNDCGVKDISRKLTNLEDNAITKIKFSKGFVFANLQAANEFEDQRARFFQENEQRDDYMEVREGLDLLNSQFRDYMTAFANAPFRPWYTSHIVFWIASLLLLSWPLRLLIEYQTAYVHYHVTKLFGTNYLSPSSRHYTGPLTRSATIESRELEAALAMPNNYVIVPSYSEALLMDPVNTQSQMHQDRQGNLHIHTRQRYHQGGSTETLCNENVIPNYGAFVEEGRPLILQPPHRSRSLSLMRSRSSSQRGERRQPSASPSGRTTAGTGFRSFSFGSLIYLASRAGCYRTLMLSPEHTEDESCATAPPTIPEEPPPPYEVALQMCKPLWGKLKRSLTGDSNKIRAVHSPSNSSRLSTVDREMDASSTSGITSLNAK